MFMIDTKYTIHEQIDGTKAKSQQIVVQRLLSCLQHLVPYLSRLQRIYLSQYLKLQFSRHWHPISWNTRALQFYDVGYRKDTYRYSRNIRKGDYRLFQHGF